MTKRIGLFLDSLIGGGAERIVLNFAYQFSRLGHDVHIILIKNEIEHDVAAAPFKIHALSDNGLLSKYRPVNKFKLSKRLQALIQKIESDGKVFDFYITNAEDSDRITKMAGLPNVYIRYRNSMVAYLEHKLGRTSGLKRLVRRWRWGRKFKAIYGGRNFITVSDALQDEIVNEMRIKPASIKTIYNPFDFDSLRKKGNEFADFPVEPYIIYAAKFENRKRQDVLIKAYAKLNIPHKLVLLGGTYSASDNAWLREMKQLISDLGIRDRVIMPGFQKNPYPWIKHAQLFAMSSDSEGLPTVLIESLILGTPVVSTNCPTGPSEILTGEFSKYLSPVGDSDELAKNILLALSDYPDITEELIGKFRAEYAVGRYLEHCK